MEALVNAEDNPMSKLAGVWDVVGEIIRIHVANNSPGPISKYKIQLSKPNVDPKAVS